MSVRILASGDSAVCVELDEVISPEIHNRVLALDAVVSRLGSGILETVPTYRSLLVHYDPGRISFAELASQISGCLTTLHAQPTTGRLWEIPVVYGNGFGIDLEGLAARHGLAPGDVVRRHSSATYRVYMIGFVPGFSYLGGLDPELATPRLATPRRTTPAGSISIGGAQTAVGSIPAPSGWHLIGRTPVRTFMARRDPVCLLAPGDCVRFRPIAETEWQELALAAQLGQPVARLVS